MKTIQLKPFSPTDFRDFVKRSVAGYAQGLERAGHMPRTEALRRAQKEFKGLLPKGMKTPAQFFYVVEAQPLGKAVGTLWLGLRGKGSHKTAFIFDIRINPGFQGRGYGGLTMKEVERWAHQMKASRVGLNVFTHNERAHKLYLKCGFSAHSIQMSKEL